jgi:hypothetical protein
MHLIKQHANVFVSSSTRQSRAASMRSNITFRHRYSLSEASALLLILAHIALLIPGSLSTSPRTGNIILSRVTEAAATQATISFETFASVPSGGSITLQFPFGRYGNGTTSLLGVMHVQGSGEKAVEAVNLLTDGVTVVYLTQDGGLTKVVSLDPYTNKNYTGSISQFNPTQWNSYNGGPTDPASAGYMLKDQPTPLDDYMPFIGSTGSCGVSTFSLGSSSSSFVRNGNVIIVMSASVPQGLTTVTCSGLTIFKTSSIFGGLRIWTSQDPVPSVVKLECVTSDNTAAHCAGVFKLGTSLVPMLYMVDGSFAWVAVKYTSNTSHAIVEDKWNSTHKNFYVSRNTLRSSISVATDILMVESQSSVYANMTSSGFSRVRSNILGGCSWFTDTHHGHDLIGYNVMAPFASGARVPDAGRASVCMTSLSYRCCSQSACTSGSDSPVFGGCPAQYDCTAGIFNSCRDSRYSNTGLSRHFRMRSGDHRAELTHSIWFRVPLSLLFVSAEFSIDASNRIAFKQNVPVTLAFFLTTDIPSGGRITLTYPLNFFSPSVRPIVAAGASSVSGLSINCSTTSDTAVVLSTAGAVITTAFTVTISGFTMGAATPGSVEVTVQTSSDPSPSIPLPSGAIFGAVGIGAAVSLSSYIYETSATLTVSFVAAPSMNSTAFKLVSVTGLTFHSLNSSTAAVSCSNLSPSSASISAVFTPSSGVLLLNLSEAASPALPSAAIVCTVSGFRNQVCLRGQSGVSAKWYRDWYSSFLPSIGSSTYFNTPSLQNAVPNLNFPPSIDESCSITSLRSALNAYSGCMSNYFTVRFEGCEF